MLPLIDIYPLVRVPFDPYANFRGTPAANGIDLPDPEPGITILNSLEHAQLAVELFDNLLPSLIEERLDTLPAFKTARRSMPLLKDIPAIRKYRVNHRLHSPAAVDVEMLAHGLPLHPGQMLFHGGSYPRLPDGDPRRVCENAGLTCRRHPSYSSPYFMVKGCPFGKPLSDAAAEYNTEVLCRGAPTVAQYR